MKFKYLLHFASICCVLFLSSCLHKEQDSAVTLKSTYNELVFKSLPEKEYQAASPFIKAAEAYMIKNKKEELTVKLKTVGDCIKISFK